MLAVRSKFGPSKLNPELVSIITMTHGRKISVFLINISMVIISRHIILRTRLTSLPYIVLFYRII